MVLGTMKMPLPMMVPTTMAAGAPDAELALRPCLSDCPPDRPIATSLGLPSRIAEATITGRKMSDGPNDTYQVKAIGV